MINKNLEKVKKLLDNRFYCNFKDENILEISLDKNDVPFLFLVTEKPNLILMSFSVDFDNASVGAQLALEINDITKTGIAETFYFSKNGELLWEDEAYASFMNESPVVKHPLMDMEAISSSKH